MDGERSLPPPREAREPGQDLLRGRGVLAPGWRSLDAVLLHGAALPAGRLRGRPRRTVAGRNGQAASLTVIARRPPRLGFRAHSAARTAGRFTSSIAWRLAFRRDQTLTPNAFATALPS